MGLIYKATNIINNKSYIGQTEKTLQERRDQHYYQAFKKETETYFYNALRKYGKDSFIWEILEDDIDKKELDKRETYWISHFNTFLDGYNLTQGGENADNLKNWRMENPELAKHYAQQGYLKMRDILEKEPDREEKRKQKAIEGMRQYVNEHYEEWKEKSYNTYLKNKDKVDAQFQEFHKQQSKKVLCVETGMIYPSASEASRQTKISQGNISSCCRGERLSAGKGPNKEKLHWKYI